MSTAHAFLNFQSQSLTIRETTTTYEAVPVDDGALPSYRNMMFESFERPQSISRIDDEEQCPVCMKTFDYDDLDTTSLLSEEKVTPLWLPCQGRHVICLTCTEAWCNDGDRPNDARQKTDACPLCRERIFRFDEPAKFIATHHVDDLVIQLSDILFSLAVWDFEGFLVHLEREVENEEYRRHLEGGAP